VEALFLSVTECHSGSDVRQIHTAAQLLPNPSPPEVEIAISKLKKYKSTGISQTLAELVQARGKTLLPQIHKVSNSIWNKEELSDQWKESVILPVHKKGDKTDCNNYRQISLLSTSFKNFIDYPSQG
jgi:hypothetical protein